MDTSDTVSAELGIRLVVPGEKTIVPLMASFVYTAADPFAVRVAFHVGQDAPVEWSFSRELLARGIEGPDGLGDVRVWPSADSVSGMRGTVLNLQLSSPYGEAQFEVPVREVESFLRRAYRAVSRGREAEHIDFESKLADLLRESY